MIDHVLDDDGDNSDSSLRAAIRSLASLRRKLRISAACQVSESKPDLCMTPFSHKALVFSNPSFLQVDIQEASDDVYAAVTDSKLAVKIGPGDWEPPSADGTDWHLEVSGENFAVWSRGGCA